MMPAVPRVGDYIAWQPDPDGYHEEHKVVSVIWDLDSHAGPYVLVNLEDRKVGGKSVNPPATSWPGG